MGARKIQEVDGMGWIRIREGSVNGRILETLGDAPEEIIMNVRGDDGRVRQEIVNVPCSEDAQPDYPIGKSKISLAIALREESNA